MNIELGKYKVMEKGSLKAFFDIHFVDIGLVLCDCKFFHSAKGPFVTLPDREYKDKNGEIKYQKLALFPSREKHEHFQKVILKLIQETLEGKKNYGSSSTPKVSPDPSPSWGDLPF